MMIVKLDLILAGVCMLKRKKKMPKNLWKDTLEYLKNSMETNLTRI